MSGTPLIVGMNNAGLTSRSYNLALKFIPNIVALMTQEQLEYFEQNLDQIKPAVIRALDFSVSNLVAVNRYQKPKYPDWIKSVLHPELESTGPAEFDASKLEQWLHPKQRAGVIDGNKLYEHLKSNNMLEGCLGLRDLEEIQKKGIKFFRKHFKGKAVFGWKSVVLGHDGNLSVPSLYKTDDRVVLHWYRLAFDWDADCMALRFAA